MNINAVTNKIDAYFNAEDKGPIIIDVQTHADMEALTTRYFMSMNSVIKASDEAFCNADEFPKIDNIFNYLTTQTSPVFIRELSSFYFLKGESALKDLLSQFLGLNTKTQVILITWRCKKYLNSLMEADPRFKTRIFIVDSEITTPLPKLIFISRGVMNPPKENVITGISQIASAVESEAFTTLYVETAKTSQTYPSSIYAITDITDPYEALTHKDPTTTKLDPSLTTPEGWQYLLDEFKNTTTWSGLITSKFSTTTALEKSIFEYQYNKSNPHWLLLYLIALKLFPPVSDPYLTSSAQRANSTSEFLQNIYCSILDLNPDDPTFSTTYEHRKALLNALENPDAPLVEFCKLVRSKNRLAIYYLTDNTQREKELLFSLIAEYQYPSSELTPILKTVYPALYSYLQPFHFKEDLLNNYFQDYKYQKVINTISPEFMATVEDQAQKRDYISLLRPRTSVMPEIDLTHTQGYFMDAMGVEFLSYITAKCSELNLQVSVTVCRCELPSITSANKEFLDYFPQGDAPFALKKVSDLDDIKHHGKFNCTYEKSKLPIHLIKELEIIDQLLQTIAADLMSETSYEKAVLVADHGASRLAVISGQENTVTMSENGQHSGRCCPKGDTDTQPQNAVDAGDFWSLANYDRFKGSRKAEVEAHGGATLEEVVVPIIEITLLGNVDVRLLPLDESSPFTPIPEITFTPSKPASFRIYISKDFPTVSIEVAGTRYPAKQVEPNYYVVETDLRRSNQYSADVYAGETKIATALPFKLKNKGMSENKMF